MRRRTSLDGISVSCLYSVGLNLTPGRQKVNVAGLRVEIPQWL
jgi:hypothetical protein